MKLALLSLVLLAAVPVTAPRQTTTGVRPDWLERDLARVEQVRRALERPALTVEALREAVGSCDVREDRDVGGGARRVLLAVYGGHTTLWIHAYAAAPVEGGESAVARLVVEQSGYRESWAGVAPALRRAWAEPVAEVELGLRLERTDAVLLGELVRRTAVALGGAAGRLGGAEPIDVPAELAPAFALLTDPLARLTVGLELGDDGAPPPGREALQALVAAGRYDLVRAVLRGPNPEARAYAAHALLQHVPLELRDATTIDTLSSWPLELETSQGCLVSRERWAGALTALAQH